MGRDAGVKQARLPLRRAPRSVTGLLLGDGPVGRVRVGSDDAVESAAFVAVAVEATDEVPSVLVAQGDGPGALAAYRKGLGIREALAARDPANAQWQTDLAVSCGKLGTLEHAQSVEVRRSYLIRGRSILVKLKEQGRLLPNKDWTAWFDSELGSL